MSNKILYAASTVGHLKSFHLPYLERLNAIGWTVHTAGKGADQPLPGVEQGFDISFRKNMFSPYNLIAVLQLIILLRRERYQVISVHTSLAAFFVRIAVLLSGLRKKTVVINTVHGYLFDDHTPWLKRIILLSAEKLTASTTDLLLTMNLQDTSIAQKHHLCRKDIVQINGMGVNFNRFYPPTATQRQQARERFQLPSDAFVLVYAAEFSARKNQSELIQAISSLPERTYLLLAGIGGKLEECQALASRLGVEDRVRFAGFVNDVETCYYAADLCVSSSRSEGLPFNLMEAMHCALPVVATLVKGHEDLVLDGENGFLYPFGNRSVLCQTITTLMQSPALCRKLGDHGLQCSEQYRLDIVLEENMALLASFFQKKGLAETELYAGEAAE